MVPSNAKPAMAATNSRGKALSTPVPVPPKVCNPGPASKRKRAIHDGWRDAHGLEKAHLLLFDWHGSWNLAGGDSANSKKLRQQMRPRKSTSVFNFRKRRFGHSSTAHLPSFQVSVGVAQARPRSFAWLFAQGNFRSLVFHLPISASIPMSCRQYNFCRRGLTAISALQEMVRIERNVHFAKSRPTARSNSLGPNDEAALPLVTKPSA